MATLILSDEQVIELVKQLPVEQQVEVFRFLLLQQWGKWESLSRYRAEKARLVAQEKGLDWKLKAVPDDPDDDMVVECAVMGSATHLVTGNKHLLSLANHQGIAILKAAEFVALLSSP